MNRNVLPLAAALTVLAAAGGFELVRAGRRADPEAAAAVQARFDAIPLSLGGWTGTVGTPDAKQMKQAGAVASGYRTYTRGTDRVDIMLLAGDPGDVGAHDPERCYGGAGYQPVGSRRRREMTDPVTGLSAACWTARFDTETYPATAIQVNWGWSADGTLTAADDARLEFVGKSMLVKLYVTRRLPLAATDAAAADPTADFLTAFLPAFRAAVTATQR